MQFEGLDLTVLCKFINLKWETSHVRIYPDAQRQKSHYTEKNMGMMKRTDQFPHASEALL